MELCMNFNQLKYFLALAETKSFTKAAEQNYISQAAITLQIKTLEEEVGCLLVDRSKRPIELTYAGEALLMEARALLERMNTALDRTREASVGLAGSLRIGYTKGYERSDLSNRLRQFHRRFPNVLISCHRAGTDQLAAGLLKGEYDLIFTWDSTNLRSDPRTEFHEVERVPLIAALYPAHPLARRAGIKRAELKGEKILYMSPSEAADSFGDSAFLQMYREAGYQPDILFRSSDTESILMMVAAEEGISILPAFFTEKLTNADHLVFLPMVGKNEVEEIDAIWCRDNTNPILHRMVEAVVREEADPTGPAE